MFVKCECEKGEGGPTGWYSAAASALGKLSKATDLAREAVRCNGGLAGWLETAIVIRIYAPILDKPTHLAAAHRLLSSQPIS